MEMARTNAIDQGRHNDVSLHASFQASLDYCEVSLSLAVWLFLVTHLLIRVNVFFVGEDVVFRIFARDGLIT